MCGLPWGAGVMVRRSMRFAMSTAFLLILGLASVCVSQLPGVEATTKPLLVSIGAILIGASVSIGTARIWLRRETFSRWGGIVYAERPIPYHCYAAILMMTAAFMLIGGIYQLVVAF